MIGIIARKEFTEAVRDGRFRLFGCSVLALLLASLAVGWRSARDVAAQRAAAERLTREHWLHQPPKNPHAAAHYGVYAFKPKPLLSFVDEGIDPYTGVAVYLEAHRQNDFAWRPAADGTLLQRFGNLTAAVTMQVLVPLLIVLLCFGTFAGEREQGTLRQLLCLGLPPRTLALGKMVGLGSALLVLLVPAAMLGSATLVLASDDRSIGRMGVLIGVYLLYFIIWLGISLAVSARARSGRTALVTLLGLWMASGLLAPRAATELARWLHPTPSLLEFQATMARERESGPDGQSSPEQRERELEARVLAQYRVDSLSRLPVSFAGLALDAGEAWGNQVYDRNYGKLWDTFEAQEQVRAAVGAVFPLLAVRVLSQSLSGTDFVQHRRFATAAEQYRRVLVARMNRDMTEKAKGLDFEYRASDSLWASVPAFSYEEPSLLWVLRRQVASLAVVALWAAAAIGLATAVAGRIRGVETGTGAV